MKILLVDNSRDALDELKASILAVYPDEEIYCFESSLEALAMARTQEIDIAFLAVEMPELNGLDLGQYLVDLYPLVNLIFLAEERDRAYDAMVLHASGYMLRPVTQEAIKKELDDLRHSSVQKNHKRVFAQTFGNFELFVDGKPIDFRYSRTKEIVALLINNRGAETSNGEIIATLWEDDGDPEKKASYLSNLRQDLQNTLTRYKLNGIILKRRGRMAIAKDKIECDLFDWLEKKQNSQYHYIGDYMNQYSWPEYTHAELDEINYALEDEGY
jgi:two-component SAPR family response regulator